MNGILDVGDDLLEETGFLGSGGLSCQFSFSLSVSLSLVGNTGGLLLKFDLVGSLLLFLGLSVLDLTSLLGELLHEEIELSLHSVSLLA